MGDSIAQYVQASAGLRGRTTEKKAPEGSAASGGTTIPQVGESFIDRIIELTRSDRDAEQDRRFIAERTQKQFEYNERAIALRSEQDRWKELLADLRSDAAARKDLDEATRGRIAQQLRYAIEDANAKWAAMSRIEAEFAANRTGRTAEIYAPSAAYRDVASNDLVLNTTVLGTVSFCTETSLPRFTPSGTTSILTPKGFAASKASSTLPEFSLPSENRTRRRWPVSPSPSGSWGAWRPGS